MIVPGPTDPRLRDVQALLSGRCPSCGADDCRLRGEVGQAVALVDPLGVDELPRDDVAPVILEAVERWSCVSCKAALDLD